MSNLLLALILINGPFLLLVMVSLFPYGLRIACGGCWDRPWVHIPIYTALRKRWKFIPYGVSIGHHITIRGCAWEDSRTCYPPTKRDPNPNRLVYLCYECAEHHHDVWDDRWQDVYSGSGVWSGTVKTPVVPRKPGIIPAIRRRLRPYEVQG